MSHQLTPERLTSLLLVAWSDLDEVHEAARELAMLIEGQADQTAMLIEVRKIARVSQLPLPIVRLVRLLNDRIGESNGAAEEVEA